MYTDIFNCMPYSMTYSDDHCVASYGNFMSKKEANDAAIKAVQKNPSLLLSNFHISENKPIEKPFTETLAVCSVTQYKVHIRTENPGVYAELGTFNSPEEANNAIINDMMKNHPEYTIEDYYISNDKRNIL